MNFILTGILSLAIGAASIYFLIYGIRTLTLANKYLRMRIEEMEYERWQNQQKGENENEHLS